MAVSLLFRKRSSRRMATDSGGFRPQTDPLIARIAAKIQNVRVTCRFASLQENQARSR
jgi:hypothetical protein